MAFKTFRVKSDIYSQPDKEGNSKVIRKGMITKIELDTNSIRMVEEVVNSKGQISRTSCNLNTYDNINIRVYEKYEECVKLVRSFRIIGFGRK